MSKEINYGKYRVPNSIKKLHEINEALNSTEIGNYREFSLEHILFYLVEEDYRYFITPPDLIPFISTGGDGIHFGFLTDFGSIKDLDQAPIVCVSPTNDPPLKLVARNINEFLSLVCIYKDPEIADQVNSYHSEENFMKYINEFDEWLKKDENRYRMIQKTIEKLKENFDIIDIPHPYEYWNQIKKERASKGLVKTLDGIGIPTKLVPTNYKPYDFNQKDLNCMKDYFASCSYKAKLAFIRDAFFALVLSSINDIEYKNFLVNEMKGIGLIDEAARLNSMDIF